METVEKEEPFVSKIAKDDTIDFGEEVETPEEEVAETPEVEAKEEKVNAEEKHSPKMFDEEKFASVLADKLSAANKPKETVAEEPVQQDYIDSILSGKEINIDKEFPAILSALNDERKQTQQSINLLAEHILEQRKFIEQLQEERGMSALKAEAGDVDIEEIKAEAAKRAHDVMGTDEKYQPMDDEDGRAWVKIANNMYKKVLAERKGAASAAPAKTSKAPTKTVARSMGKPDDTRSARLKSLDNDEIDFG
jgi:hypothetical protein